MGYDGRMLGYQSVLVFRCSDGVFMHEPTTHEGSSRELALREALCEGNARAFGRTFVGLSRLEPLAPGPVSIDDLPEITTSHEATTITHEPVLPLAEPERVVELVGVADVAWWRKEGAFGIASELGVALQRAGCRDAALARRYAALVGEWIAHQTTLYPVTSTALPFVLDLLEHPEVRSRDILEGWLFVVAEAAVEEAVDMDALRAEVERLPVEVRAIMFPEGVEARAQEGLDLAREVRAALVANRSRIERLAERSQTLAEVLVIIGAV